MKIKNIVGLVAAAVYSAGVAQAASNLAPGDEIHQLAVPNLTAEQINQMQVNTAVSNNQTSTMMANDGLNVQINQQGQKFLQEDGLSGEHVYFIRLHHKPATLYTGGIKGLDATHIKELQAETGVEKLFVAGKAQSERLAKYESFLTSQQNKVATNMNALVGEKKVRNQYTLANNGFTVKLTQQEAQRISEMSDVAFVHRAKNYELHTDAGPQTISADKVWTGETTGTELKGEGVIMGIVDTGINSDHASFADVSGDGYDHTNPWGEGVYVGACAEEANAALCNDKLIGIRTYPEISDAFDEMSPGWPAIGEDFQGHGSHVASTAAGNLLTDVDYVLPEGATESDGTLIKADMFPEISGVAPRANIVSYQVCHGTNDSGYRGCPFEAMLGGIEDAIMDGVDVINFSIGGQDSVSPWNDGVEMAFFAAREAGILVAVAAGNGGQDCGAECFGSIDHASPWLLSVAATTHNREIAIETSVSYEGFIVDPVTGEPMGSEVPSWSTTGVVGGSINQANLTGVVVWAKDYYYTDPETGNRVKDYNGYCTVPYDAGTFDFFKDVNTTTKGDAIPGADTGATNVIVVCQRHNPTDANANARTAKVANVAAGGADGFIMYNRDRAQGTVTTSYQLPSVHFTYDQWNGLYLGYNNPDNTDGLEDWIDAYSERGHMITIGQTAIERRTDDANADWLANFSSRGPSPSTPEMLIPQVSAPGVNIYAAYSDEKPFTATPATADFATLGGTSMASPHVAGSMALIRQAHPDWSATEIQSALALTADNVVQYRRLNDPAGDIGQASTYRAGAGRINVANAIDAGLIMDETPENFMAANPTNGGEVHRLNMPQLVNMSCKPTCQWVRTVKATKDGSWSVSHSDVLNWNYDMRNQSAQNGVNISATPSEFTLAAGETQTIVIEASIMDTQDIFSNAEVELHSDLILTEVNGAAPESHMPVVFKYDMNNMPARLKATAHRNNGSAQFNGLELPELDQTYTRVFAPVKADVQTIVLPKDDDGYFPWSASADLTVDMAERLDEATHSITIDVPANAKRLMVESQGTLESELEGHLDIGNILVYVGKDYNGNGQADPFEEILCVSNHIIFNNFCNINNPEEGTYWAVFYNSGELNGQAGNWTPEYPDLEPETFSYAVAVVTDEISSEMTLDVGASNGSEPVSATLNWNIPGMAKDDLYYSVLDFGTSEVNAGNVGKVAFKLLRGQDDVHLDVTQDTAKAGDVIPFTFEVQPNDSGADRNFTISATVPEGLSFSSEDVLASSDIVENITVEGNVVTISGTQPDTSAVTPDYIVTTNDTDASCQMPNFGNSNPGGYVDLEEFNFNAVFSGFNYGVDESGNPVGDNNITSRDGVELPVAALFNGQYDSFHLYNNTEALNSYQQNSLFLRGTGNVGVFYGPFFAPYHFRHPYKSFPYESMSPLWRARGQAEMNSGIQMMSVPLINSYSETAGISLASTQTGWGIIEYDNARSYEYGGQDRTVPRPWPYIWNELDDRYDFQVIFNVNTRHGKNEHELYMAYDNIDFGTQNARGSIGLQGFTGPIYSRGPISSPYYGEDFAFDDLDQKIHDGLVVCYDYYGPESSQFEVTIWTKVSRDATGTVQTFDATSTVDGMADFTMTHSLNVPSAISLPAIADMSVDENASISFDVIYADNSELATANLISATGDNMTAVADGGESGDSVTITPDANFHGDIEVTVSVSDIENPNDAANTTFTLTVNSDGVELGCTDSTATNYDANATDDDGSCVFPEPEVAQSSSGGGSINIFMLLLTFVGASCLRTRK